MDYFSLDSCVEKRLSEGGFDAQKYIFTTHKPDSMVRVPSVTPNSPWFTFFLFKTVDLKHRVVKSVWQITG
jgi:hypothetical protein